MTPLAPKKAPHQRGLSAKLSKHFVAHPGQHMAVEDLVAMAGNGCTNLQVAQAVLDMINRKKLPGLEVVTRGHVWLYKPNGKPEKKLLEEVGRTKSGSLILQDEDGDLWSARPLEVS